MASTTVTAGTDTDLSDEAWAEKDGPYNVHTGPQGVGTGNVDYLIQSVAARGAAHVPDGLTVAQERSNMFQAAAYADAKALSAASHPELRGVERVRRQAEDFARWLREFDAVHGTWCGQLHPDDAHFDREGGSGREYVRQEWAAASK